MKRQIISLILSIFLIFPNLSLAKADIKIEEPQADIQFFADVLYLIENDYPFEKDEGQLIEAGVKGMLRSVDPYSDYYTKEEAEEAFSEIDGNFTGIGVYIEEKEEGIIITGTIKGGEAEKAGLKEDDIIVSVDDVDVKGMSLGELSSMIKGEAGTLVELVIKREGEALRFKMERKNIIVNPVEYKIVNDHIGYISLDTFNAQSSDEMKKALNFFEAKDIDNIILDVRDNPGGLFFEAIEISKLLLPKGDIVHQRTNNKKLITHKSFKDAKKYNLVLLINENSASASEILAGAIKDRGAGKLVGEKTFGKGIIQSFIPLTGGRVIKLTTAEYLTPNQVSIHGKGIEPDIVVENTSLDLQLEKAIEVFE